jgi:hypothetical protein
MSRILIYAIPFGGGPAGKAAVIADYLKCHHNIALTSYSHAVHLLRLSCPGIEVLDCHSRGSEAMIAILERGVDVFVSLMDVRVASFVKKLFPHTRVVLVDSLLSWRVKEYLAGELVDFDSIDFHICQYVPGVEADTVEAKLGHNVNKLHIVAPLVQHINISAPQSAYNGILIHFGGLASPVSEWHLYVPFVDKVTEILVDRYAPHTRLMFTGGVEVTNHLRTKFGNHSNVFFECLAYKKFQEAIAHSTLVLTTPGLETAYESFFIGKPVLFLPAVNSTQLHQLEFFETAGLPNVVPPAIRARLEAIANAAEPYSLKTTWLCHLVNSLADEEGFQEHLDGSLRRLLESRTRVKKLIREQRRFWPPCLEDGLRLIERIIEGVVI